MILYTIDNDELKFLEYFVFSARLPREGSDHSHVGFHSNEYN